MAESDQYKEHTETYSRKTDIEMRVEAGFFPNGTEDFKDKRVW